MKVVEIFWPLNALKAPCWYAEPEERGLYY